MLVGFNRSLFHSGNSRRVTYTNLTPGQHTFVARDTNSAGTWSSHEARLHIYISTPLWMTSPKSERVRQQMYSRLTSVVSNSIQEVRDISQNLRPHHLDQLGLTLSIESFVEKVADSTDVEIVSEIDDVDELLPADNQINFFR